VRLEHAPPVWLSVGACLASKTRPLALCFIKGPLRIAYRTIPFEASISTFSTGALRWLQGAMSQSQSGPNRYKNHHYERDNQISAFLNPTNGHR
jgi:hypothetical protein